MTESGVEHPEIVSDGEKSEDELASTEESITEPGKVLRIGSMVKQLLEEVRQAPLDEASRERHCVLVCAHQDHRRFCCVHPERVEPAVQLIETSGARLVRRLLAHQIGHVEHCQVDGEACEEEVVDDAEDMLPSVVPC